MAVFNQDNGSNFVRCSGELNALRRESGNVVLGVSGTAEQESCKDTLSQVSFLGIRPRRWERNRRCEVPTDGGDEADSHESENLQDNVVKDVDVDEIVVRELLCSTKPSAKEADDLCGGPQ